jgi:amino acid transporter
MIAGTATTARETAAGTAVPLTAVVATTGAAVELGTDLEEVTDAAAENAETIGIVGAIALIAIMLISYYCGGYVAGRMVRFNRAMQGVAIWVWAVVIAIVVAILAAIGGANFNILANVNGFPRIPIDEGRRPSWTRALGGMLDDQQREPRRYGGCARRRSEI